MRQKERRGGEYLRKWIRKKKKLEDEHFETRTKRQMLLFNGIHLKLQ